MEDLPRRLAASGAVEIRARLGSISGGEVLDVATGSGAFIDTLMKALKDHGSFVGIDISKEDLKSAEKRFEGRPVRLMEMNAESLEFADGSFDTVSTAYSLHHLARVGKALAEMYRVLKPGGSLIVQEEFRDGELTEAQKTNILQHAWMAQIDSLLGKTHNMAFTKQEVKEAIGSLPLEPVEILESTHPVECLFCDKKLACDEPENQKEIDDSLKEVDSNLKRLSEIADPEHRARLEKLGEELKERNRKFGNSHPPILFAIGRKPLKPQTSLRA